MSSAKKILPYDNTERQAALPEQPLSPFEVATFIEGMKTDNKKVAGFRAQACNAVKQQAQMMRRAQQQAQGASPFGGADSITGGPMRVPQGALGSRSKCIRSSEARPFASSSKVGTSTS